MEKDLRLKAGIVKRLYKEYIYYQKEVSAQQKKIDKMIQENQHESEVKQQKRVLEETTSILPDSMKRLVAAHKELNEVIDELLEKDETFKSAEFENAKAILSEAAALMA